MDYKPVTCQGCDRFQRSAPASSIGTCNLHKVEVLENHSRYCVDRSATTEYLTRFAKGPKQRKAA
jgi:hypothetical protein